MEFKLTEEMSALTSISKRNLDKLSEVYIYCIVEFIKETVLADETVTDIDLGFGKLLIDSSNNNLRFKFVPSAKLVEESVNSVKHKQNLLDIALESSLINKIENAQKDILS